MDAAAVVAELAEAGSVDALLARHADLTADEVKAVLHRATHLLEADAPVTRELSDLYRTYNGFVAGLFSGSATLYGLQDESERREAMLHRLSGFLSELANDVQCELQLPEGEQDPDEVVDRVLRDIDAQLADYFQIGIAAFRYSILQGTGDDAARDAEHAEKLLLELGHPPMLFKSVLGPPADDTELTLERAISACLRLLREIVAGVLTDENTCFVALPFAPRFEERYPNFYRNVARRLDARAVRAWGGIAGEEHQELLLALIAKSGTLLADVTEPNANVALEIGFALGRGMHVFLVAEESEWKRAANVQLDWVYPYFVDRPDWEIDAAERAGLYFTALKSLRRPGAIPSWSAKPVQVMRVLAGIAEQGADPQEPASQST